MVKKVYKYAFVILLVSRTYDIQQVWSIKQGRKKMLKFSSDKYIEKCNTSKVSYILKWMLWSIIENPMLLQGEMGFVLKGYCSGFVQFSYPKQVGVSVQ